MFEHAAEATLMIIDDERANVVLLERILASFGYTDVHGFDEAEEALDRFDDLAPDLICTDLHMPRISGFQLIDAVRGRLGPDDFLPILMLTGDLSHEAETEALARGANDFINKPFQNNQIRLRIGNLLRTRQMHLQLKRQNEDLEVVVTERTMELEAARLDILERLAQAAEFRDHLTGMHTQRVGALSAMLARRLGLSDHDVDVIRRAAPLHDVGKIGIPDRILLKQGRLSPEEYETMKRHVDVGVRLLARSKSTLVKMAELIALTHHERWDGTGYPRRLKGKDIPLVGRIVAVADVFDTLLSERPYKMAWSIDDAVEEMKRQSGHWFAPHIVDALLALMEEQPDFFERFEASLPAAG